MLERLEVKNLAAIAAATLRLGPGLTVLSGETGTGKSILVGALGLLLGGKADPSLIRPSASSLLVTAWVSGAPYSRKVTAARSVSRIDGEVVTIGELREALSARVTIHTQHAALALGRKNKHRDALDRSVEQEVLNNYRKAFHQWRSLQKEVDELREKSAQRERRLDILRFELEEISKVNPQIDELQTLQDEARRLGHADEIIMHLATAQGVLSQGEQNALEAVSLALRELQAASRLTSSLEALSADLAGCHDSLSAIASELDSYGASLEADPQRLEQVQSRLADLQRLMRKYGPELDDVLSYAADLRNEIEQLESVDLRLSELEKELELAESRLSTAAVRLSEERTAAARRLQPLIEEELHQLGMPAATFKIRIKQLAEAGVSGKDDVSFLFAATPDLELAPVEKAASGGELSRIMLALALHTGADSETLVFDEIDVGIGGETAGSVAARLKRLASKHQVLVVTHLAQIAARADAHFRVMRREDGSVVELVEGEQRVRELARMLSGSYSATALEHARELLSSHD